MNDTYYDKGQLIHEKFKKYIKPDLDANITKYELEMNDVLNNNKKYIDEICEYYYPEIGFYDNKIKSFEKIKEYDSKKCLFIQITDIITYAIGKKFNKIQTDNRYKIELLNYVMQKLEINLKDNENFWMTTNECTCINCI